MARPFLVPLLVLALAFPAVLATEPHLSDDFESGDDGWASDGPGIAVSCGDGDCVLRVDPPCCSTPTVMDHALDVPLVGMLALDVAFRPDNLWGDTDSAVWLLLDEGLLLMHTTEWINNGITLYTDVAHDMEFTWYETPGEWIHLRILVDGDGLRAQGQVLDEDGAVVAASHVLPLNASATTITGVRVSGVAWSDHGRTGFDYDDVLLAPTDAAFVPRTCSTPHATLWTPGEIVAPWELQGNLYVQTSCAVATWSIDYGDGTVETGVGWPPSFLEHAYAGPGTYAIRVEGALTDGQTFAVATTLRAVAQQVVEGRLQTSVAGHALAEDGFIVLESVASGLDSLEVRWPIAAGALDVRFFDAAGAPLPHAGCARLDTFGSEACRAPAGAAYADVVGTAVDAAWRLEYRYVPAGQ